VFADALTVGGGAVVIQPQDAACSELIAFAMEVAGA
jgi:hypothetical protein